MEGKGTWLLACVHYVTFMKYELNCVMLLNIALKYCFIVLLAAGTVLKEALTKVYLCVCLCSHSFITEVSLLITQANIKIFLPS